LEEEIRGCFLTVTVISYNSELFISETLKSIAEQSSKDIQIILSDDASIDNTVDILKNWKKLHENSFYEILLLQSKVNKGVIENFSRTFEKAKGLWLKAIAGDDLFYTDAIKSMRIDAKTCLETSVIIGKAKIFGQESKENAIIPREKLVKNLNTINQFKKYIYEGYTFPGVSFLIKTELLREIDVFKHAKGKVEDIPFQLELLTKGYLFKISDHIYVKYRKHINNVSRKNEDEILSKVYLDYQKILLKYAFKDFKIVYVMNTFWNLCLGKLIFLFGNKGSFCLIINKIKMKLQPKRFFNMISRVYRTN